MTITISSSDAGFAVLGGLLIGISTTIHLLLKGRVTGMSGIFFSLLTYDKSSFQWKLSLISGMLFMSSIMMLGAGSDIVKGTTSTIFDKPEINISGLNFAGFCIAGLLVGIGSKLGAGCTSGHGVCGMPTLSLRSWVAVGIFMSFGIILASLRYYFEFLQQTQGVEIVLNENYDANAAVILVLSTIVFVIGLIIEKSNKETMKDLAITFFVGLIFALGLGLGGMLKRRKIIGFLTFNKDWDPQLLILFMSAVGFNMASFQYIIRIKQKPIYSDKLQIPLNSQIDLKLIVGQICFGFGWGIGGLCPGPVFSLFTQFSLQIGLAWTACFAIGQMCGKFLEIKFDEILAQKQQQQQSKVIPYIDKPVDVQVLSEQKLQI